MAVAVRVEDITQFERMKLKGFFTIVVDPAISIDGLMDVIALNYKKGLIGKSSNNILHYSRRWAGRLFSILIQSAVRSSNIAVRHRTELRRFANIGWNFAHNGNGCDFA